MRHKKSDKLKLLFKLWPMHTIATAKWLSGNGITYSNLSKYLKSQWIEKVGSGAFKRCGDTVSWEGAVFGLQTQQPKTFYIGGKTALELLGSAHFIPISQTKIFIFTSLRKALPLWFTSFMQKRKTLYEYLQYSFLPPGLGTTTYDCGEFKIEISTRERAALEICELFGRFHDFEECKILFENLGTLRPQLVQSLLDNCTSVKAKRLLLFLNKQLGHHWIHDLDLENIDLGSGPRNLYPGGFYDPEFKITYPKELFRDDKPEV